MPAPLLAVDGPSILFRAYFALPSSITDDDGRPVNGLLGMANLVLQAVERYAPRAVVLCWGAEAASYRVAAYPPYHADRPPVPDDLGRQFAEAEGFFAAFGWPSLHSEDLEADDLLGSLARREAEAGGEALLLTGDRDMFQCVGRAVRVLYPRGGKEGIEVVDPAGVRSRYGVDPAQVPDFIALRGDPSDGLPGAKGIGEKTAAALLSEHGDLETLLAAAADDAAAVRAGLRPRVVGALRDQAAELRVFRDVATLRDAGVERPPDRALDPGGAAAAARAHGMRRLAERLEKLG